MAKLAALDERKKDEPKKMEPGVAGKSGSGKAPTSNGYNQQFHGSGDTDNSKKGNNIVDKMALGGLFFGLA